MIGPEHYEQTPEVPESAVKTNDDAKKSSEPPSSKTQLPHSPTEKLGGDHGKREGTGKIGERAPPRKDDGGERRDLTRSQPNEEIKSSRNTSRQDPTPAAENKSSRKPNMPKRKKPLG
ncbi:hypothetical protein BTUL_0004g00070 [Botrytis tulipae]|uniref:Uncharacterized protein n=1 Tax=Botrytis tulipae TaxID=87230 RepID=A0A4Z1FD80_9HELO|nr:hypothetical protein BTUL_0004g00070 [Botrytis tulipae]